MIQFNGFCYADIESVIAAAKSSSPVLNASGFTFYSQVEPLALDTIRYTVATTQLSASGAATYATTLVQQLPSCVSQSIAFPDVFAMPSVVDLQTVFYVGFSAPVIVYLSAWAYNVVVRFINDNNT